MKIYLYYFLLLIIIVIAAAESWGETSKTIMYAIAILGVIGLIILRTTEKTGVKKQKNEQ